MNDIEENKKGRLEIDLNLVSYPFGANIPAPKEAYQCTEGPKGFFSGNGFPAKQKI